MESHAANYIRPYRRWRSRVVDREEIPLGSRFYRHTDTAEQVSLELNYTIFDFGARRGRIAEQSARVLAANFAFNDVHRRLIFQVQQAYYRLLNASAQDTAARASLANAEAVQQAAEERLSNGLATLPDVLEARSATAQSQYDVQAVLGAEENARGDLATALGAPAATMIHVEPLSEVPTPESIGETVEQVIDRALDQRPDLQAELAGIRLAQAQRKEARAAYYPSLEFQSQPEPSIALPATANVALGTYSRLRRRTVSKLETGPCLDGGARRNRLMQAEAGIRQGRVAGQRCARQHRRRSLDRLFEFEHRFSTAGSRYVAAGLRHPVLRRCASILQLRRSQPAGRHRRPEASRPGPLGGHPGADAGANHPGRFGVPVRRLDPIQHEETAAMSTNGFLPISGWGLMLAALFLTGCGRAPSFDVLGSFFPAWLVCLALGLVLTAAARWLLLRLHIVIALPVLTYPCLTALFSFALWLALFR